MKGGVKLETLEYIADVDREMTLKEYLPTLGLSVTLIKKIKRGQWYICHCPHFYDDFITPAYLCFYLQKYSDWHTLHSRRQG